MYITIKIYIMKIYNLNKKITKGQIKKLVILFNANKNKNIYTKIKQMFNLYYLSCEHAKICLYYENNNLIIK